jgi:hypothetical protein
VVEARPRLNLQTVPLRPTDAEDLAKDAYAHLARACAALRLAVQAGRPKCALHELTEDVACALEVWKQSVRRVRASGIRVPKATVTEGTW